MSRLLLLLLRTYQIPPPLFLHPTQPPPPTSSFIPRSVQPPSLLSLNPHTNGRPPLSSISGGRAGALGSLARARVYVCVCVCARACARVHVHHSACACARACSVCVRASECAWMNGWMDGLEDGLVVVRARVFVCLCDERLGLGRAACLCQARAQLR